jgi:hypothetical protein
MLKTKFSMNYFFKKSLLALLSSIIISANFSCTSNKKSDEGIAEDSVANAEDSTAMIDSTSTSFNTLTDQEKSEGWQLLFDGNTAIGFRGYEKDSFPSKGWTVKDGILSVEHTGTEEEGFGGDIITKDQFENFEFKTDFKLSPKGNSGLLYRVKEVKGVPAWHSGPEYQLLDNDAYRGGDIPLEKHSTGDNYDLIASSENAMKPVGEWNEAMIRVKDDKVEHWLNGKKVVEYTLGTPEWKEMVKKSKFATYKDYGITKKGHIGIQDHGHQLWYRNIKIRPL